MDSTCSNPFSTSYLSPRRASGRVGWASDIVKNTTWAIGCLRKEDYSHYE